MDVSLLQRIQDDEGGFKVSNISVNKFLSLLINCNRTNEHDATIIRLVNILSFQVDDYQHNDQHKSLPDLSLEQRKHFNSLTAKFGTVFL